MNYLIYVDDIKLFAKSEKELETRKETIKEYSKNKEMEFGIEKYANLIMRSGKRQKKKGI